MSKTYVITGATSGIGNVLVKLLANDNVVFAGYRNEEKAKELSSLSDNVYPFYVDYAKPETISYACEYIKSKCGKIDTLVNIAGCVVAGPVENINIDEIRRQFNVNVFGHVEIAQGLLERLDDGKIINLSSMASYGVFPFISPYCASKRCLDMFFNTLMIENKRNIKVVSIKPGVIATPLWEKSVNENIKYIDSCGDYKKEMDYVLANSKRNQTRGLTAEDVAKVIIKVDGMKNPKLSYNVGKDSIVASIVAKLPQNIINNIVKLGIKLRIK